MGKCNDSVHYKFQFYPVVTPLMLLLWFCNVMYREAQMNAAVSLPHEYQRVNRTCAVRTSKKIQWIVPDHA